ncbi:MAG: HesA/MoeB/ThiF family protein [Thermincolia bacterium]
MLGFTDDQLHRYSRHILLQEVGGKGQKKINNAKVLIVGTGGLGSPAAYYLAAAGVGTIGLVDGDTVELSNLQRQILHHTPDVGRPKVESAAEKLKALNPDINVITYGHRLVAVNAREIIQDYDAVLDGVDNFPTRFLVNDACVMMKKPFFHGGILRFYGQALTVIPGEGPCYRCIFNEPPPPGSAPSCAEAGVLGVIAGTIGQIQATEVLKYILGVGQLLVGRMLTYEALDMKFREVELGWNPGCPVCGDKPTITELMDYQVEACEMK